MFLAHIAGVLLLLGSGQATLPGIDVSHYQGAIDWSSVARSGIKFVSMKATEGLDYIDPSFSLNWKQSKAVGLKRAAYHFAHPSLSPSGQAKFFVDAVENAGGFRDNSTMQFMLDLEDADKLPPAQVWAWVQAFMQAVQTLTGRPGIVYTGYYFWRDQVGNPTDNLNAPLWVAAYIPKPLIPSAWANWTFWQYADNGAVPGIKGHVDMDLFNGSVEELDKLCFSS